MSIFENSDTYYEAVLKRNSETHEDGHMVVFNMTEEFLETKKDWFEQCRENGMSPYKALTLMDIGVN